MTTYDLYQADAFASELFTGNPAAVMPLTEWLPDDILLKIAQENNLAETAYVIKQAPGKYKLRWFTPGAEVPLCGHATLATAHILYTELGETEDEIIFETLSGPLRVKRKGAGYAMDFPAYATPKDAMQYAAAIEAACGAKPIEVIEQSFLLAIFEEAETVRKMKPNLFQIEEIGEGVHEGCVLVSAPGDQGFDFVSRLFAPGVGIPEDPVTGSAHCQLTPYWAKKLGKTEFKAWQASPRGGEVQCRLEGDRVHLWGKAVTYLRGQIHLP